MDCTPLFQTNYTTDKKIVINRGGTRSSKTYSIMQLAALFLMTWRYNDKDPEILEGTWTTVRKYRTNLDGTCLKDFLEILHKNEWYGLIDHNKTKKTFKYGLRTVELLEQMTSRN